MYVCKSGERLVNGLGSTLASTQNRINPSQPVKTESLNGKIN